MKKTTLFKQVLSVLLCLVMVAATFSACSGGTASDADTGSELYVTLKTYLIAERNSTLTAQQLRVHRSTLPHRLERIRTLTGLDLDDFATRLYLLMSFALEDRDIMKK